MRPRLSAGRGAQYDQRQDRPHLQLHPDAGPVREAVPHPQLSLRPTRRQYEHQETRQGELQLEQKAAEKRAVKRRGEIILVGSFDRFDRFYLTF